MAIKVKDGVDAKLLPRFAANMRLQGMNGGAAVLQIRDSPPTTRALRWERLEYVTPQRNSSGCYGEKNLDAGASARRAKYIREVE